MSNIKENIILELKDISISFSRNYKKDGVELTENRAVLKNISLQLSKGEIVALMGGNGSGKTTLFNIISGLIKEDSGKIFYNGNDILKLPSFKRAKLGIGRLFQDNHIFPNLSVIDNLCLSSQNTLGEFPFWSLFNNKKNKKIEDDRKRKAENILYELFEGNNISLRNKKNRLAGELSYGEKRLLGLARIFMGKYELILLDEPSAGVNEMIINNIQNMIKKLSSTNITVFLIEHEKKFITNIADRVIYLKNGKVILNDVPSVVFTRTGV